MGGFTEFLGISSRIRGSRFQQVLLNYNLHHNNNAQSQYSKAEAKLIYNTWHSKIFIF